MVIFLKLFWMTILTVVVVGLLVLAVVGIPSPSVTVKKIIPIEKFTK